MLSPQRNCVPFTTLRTHRENTVSCWIFSISQEPFPRDQRQRCPCCLLFVPFMYSWLCRVHSDCSDDFILWKRVRIYHFACPFICMLIWISMWMHTVFGWKHSVPACTCDAPNRDHWVSDTDRTKTEGERDRGRRSRGETRDGAKQRGEKWRQVERGVREGERERGDDITAERWCNVWHRSWTGRKKTALFQIHTCSINHSKTSYSNVQK